MEEIDDIAEVANNNFENMFLASDCDRLEECLAAIQHVITLEMQEILSSEYTTEEIKAALFQMGRTKAPGPDDMNALFYQKFWHIVGDNVIHAVLDFLKFGNMDPDVNFT